MSNFLNRLAPGYCYAVFSGLGDWAAHAVSCLVAVIAAKGGARWRIFCFSGRRRAAGGGAGGEWNNVRNCNVRSTAGWRATCLDREALARERRALCCGHAEDDTPDLIYR